MIELSLLLSGISVAFAIFFGISNKKRNDKKDAEQETEERATANTLMMTNWRTLPTMSKTSNVTTKRHGQRCRIYTTGFS